MKSNRLWKADLHIHTEYSMDCDTPLKGIVNLDDQGYVLTDENMATSAPGIFAAGDVRQKLLRQVSTAVGDGALAAFAAERYIESHRWWEI